MGYTTISQYDGSNFSIHVINRCRDRHKRRNQRKEKKNKPDHDSSLLYVEERLLNGGLAISGIEEMGRIYKTKQKLKSTNNLIKKANFAFSLNYEPYPEDDYSEEPDKGYFKGEGDILVPNEDGLVMIEVKAEGCRDRASIQLGRLRYMLSNPDAFVPVNEQHYQKFISFFEFMQEHSLSPKEMQLIYHCGKNKLTIDMTERIPFFDAEWFKKPAGLQKYVISYHDTLSR